MELVRGRREEKVKTKPNQSDPLDLILSMVRNRKWLSTPFQNEPMRNQHSISLIVYY